MTGIWRTLNLISQANNESQRQMTALTNVVDNLSVTMAKLAEAVAARQPTVVTPVQLSTPTRLDGSFEGIAPTNLFMSPMTGSVQAGNTSLSTGSGDVDNKPFTDPATGRTWIVPGFITCARVQHKDSYSPEERKAISKLKTPKINKDDTSTLVDFLTSVDWHKHALYNDDRLAIQLFTSELDGYFKPAVKAYLSHSVINWNEFISEFWRQFRNTTSQSKATDRLMQATQQKNQRVHQFITWVKNTASKAGVIDTKVLGRLVYKGVLPEFINASKTTIPEGGLTLEEASA